MWAYSVLKKIPIWLLIGVMEVLTVQILPFMRGLTEGLEYNVSRASEWGDRMIVFAIAIGVSIWQRQTGAPPINGWLVDRIAVIVVCLGVVWMSMIMFSSRRWDTFADNYHNVFVVPLLVFMLVMTLPVVYRAATRSESIAVVLLLLFWIGCVMYDGSTGRLQQSKWVRNHLPNQMAKWIDKKIE